ncbi:MAG: DUF2061 domain-containing protein [Patescibacteria group bacterium]
MHHKDKRYRSLAKAIAYRLISICIDYSVAYLVTKDLEKSTIIVILSNSISLAVYFIHERAWNRVTWGKNTPYCKNPSTGELVSLEEKL